MKIGLIGFGKMGSQIARRWIANGHEVVALVRSQERAAEAKSLQAQPVLDYESLAAALPKPATVWMMVPAGEVDGVLHSLMQTLPKGSLVVDGGNSDYRLTTKRADRLQKSGLEMLDIGTSGGILGLKYGFAMMVGGKAADFKKVEPLLKPLAQKQGYGYFGPSGAGHYVKMVHNGIEYGMMESYAEGYRLLKEGPFKHLDLAQAANVWQHGSIIQSLLNELIEEIIKHDPKLTGIQGYVANLGEGRWTVETAKALGIEAPAIKAALDVRIASEKGKVSYATKLLAAMRNAFGGHALNKEGSHGKVEPPTT